MMFIAGNGEPIGIATRDIKDGEIITIKIDMATGFLSSDAIDFMLYNKNLIALSEDSKT